MGWNQDTRTIVVLPTVRIFPAAGAPPVTAGMKFTRHTAANTPPMPSSIYPDRSSYIAINVYEWLDDESLYIYLEQKEELEAFTDFL